MLYRYRLADLRFEFSNRCVVHLVAQPPAHRRGNLDNIRTKDLHFRSSNFTELVPKKAKPAVDPTMAIPRRRSSAIMRRGLLGETTTVEIESRVTTTQYAILVRGGRLRDVRCQCPDEARVSMTSSRFVHMRYARLRWFPLGRTSTSSSSSQLVAGTE